jgi:hypothetical protein
MATTYTLISSVTVGSGGATTIDFTSIPQTYTDLVLKLSVRGTIAGSNQGGAQMIFNNSTATNYSFRNLRGAGTNGTPSSGSASSQAYIRVTNNHPTADNTASTFCNSEVYIPNYTSSNAKSTSEDNVSENNSTEGYMQIVAGLWTLTNAITRITLTSEATLFAQNSTAYLYGISNA